MGGWNEGMKQQAPHACLELVRSLSCVKEGELGGTPNRARTSAVTSSLPSADLAAPLKPPWLQCCVSTLVSQAKGQ